MLTSRNSTMDPRMNMNMTYRASPPYERRALQQQRTAEYPGTYNDYDGYDGYDSHPSGGSRSRRSIDTPRSHPSGGLPFDRAAQNLNVVLIETKNFYKHLLDDFERDICGIKSYTDTKTLEYLWQRKIEAKSREAAKQNAENPSAPQQGQVQQVSFDGMGNRLKKALDAARRSQPRRAAAGVDAEDEAARARLLEERDSMNRLIKKLGGQYQEIIELIDVSWRSSRKLSDLIKDLELLMTVLDNSKDLWQVSNVQVRGDYDPHGGRH